MIKNIENFFSKKIGELKIKNIQKLKIGSSYIFKGNLGRKKVIFKLRRLRHSYSIVGFRRELLMEEVLSSKELSKKPFQYRKIILYDIKYPQWVVYEYSKGEKSLGEKCLHWCFSEAFYKIVSTQDIFKILDFWQRKLTDFTHLNKQAFVFRFKRYGFLRIRSDFERGFSYYFDHCQKNNIGLKNGFTGKDKESGEKMLVKFRKTIEANNKYLCHGDLHPGNFLIYKKKIAIIDFDKVHFDIPYVDLAFAWSAGWNNPGWRKNLLALFSEKSGDKKLFHILFNLNIVRFTAHFINIKIIPGNERKLDKALGVLKNDYREAINFLEKQSNIL